MGGDKEFELNTKTRPYILATSEYFGTKNPRYFLIRSELRGDTETTLFLLGVDMLILSTQAVGRPKEDVTKELYSSATKAIKEFIEENGLKEGSTYYGEYLPSGEFKIGLEKPSWEDGNWGQKWNI